MNLVLKVLKFIPLDYRQLSPQSVNIYFLLLMWNISISTTMNLKIFQCSIRLPEEPFWMYRHNLQRFRLIQWSAVIFRLFKINCGIIQLFCLHFRSFVKHADNKRANATYSAGVADWILDVVNWNGKSTHSNQRERCACRLTSVWINRFLFYFFQSSSRAVHPNEPQRYRRAERGHSCCCFGREKAPARLYR